MLSTTQVAFFPSQHILAFNDTMITTDLVIFTVFASKTSTEGNQITSSVSPELLQGFARGLACDDAFLQNITLLAINMKAM